MKVGIITITGEANYGNSLQNYALVKTISELGLDVHTIKTEYEVNYRSLTIVNLKRYLKIVLKKNDYLNLIRKIKFSNFGIKYLNKTYSICEESNPDVYGFDCLVFGSDQIWNVTLGGRLSNNIKFFTGGFAYDIPKVSYAASLGVDYVPDNYKRIFSDNLSKFKCLSVREYSAKVAIEKILDKSVLVTLDPTMLLNKNDWLKIAKKPKYIKDNKKYILTYFLGSVNDEVNACINKLAKEKNFDLIELKSEWFDQNDLLNPLTLTTDPGEFIWLISNCQVLFTDSFHGSVFSIIFEKPFRCYPRIEDGVLDMSSRTKTLFETFKISDWCVGSTHEDTDHIFFKDYSSVSEILSIKQHESIEFLKGALNINEA